MNKSFKFSVALLLILTTLLSGCIVPDGWGDRGGYVRGDHGGYGGHHRRHHGDRGGDQGDRGGD